MKRLLIVTIVLAGCGGSDKPAAPVGREAKISTVSWEGVDRGLFDELRTWRRKKAEARGLPPFVIFSDATLRSLARSRPSQVAGLLAVHGIGQVKAAEYGQEVVQLIGDYCRQQGVSLDAEAAASVRPDGSSTTACPASDAQRSPSRRYGGRRARGVQST